MTVLRLARRGLVHHRRTGVAAVLCLALASAVIVGSLLVGASVRGALQDRFLGRLGAYRYAITTPRTFSARCDGAMPALRLAGSASDESGASVPAVTVWAMGGPADGEADLNGRLARDLGAKPGDRIFLKVAKPGGAPAESLFGRRLLEDSTVELPVVVRSTKATDFSLRPTFAAPRNAFVSLSWLQRQMRLQGRANVLLSRRSPPNPRWSLEDLGLSNAGAVVHSQSLLLTPAQIAACRRIDPKAVSTSIGLATEVRAGGRTIAYAMVASVGESGPYGEDAWLNEWAATDLGAKVGDRLSLRFLTPRRDGTYGSLQVTATVRRVTPVDESLRSLVPDLDGLTGSERIGDWKPPFPVDLSRVTPRDELYWSRYRAKPRVLLSEEALRKVWAGEGEPGKRGTTSLPLRVRPNPTPEGPGGPLRGFPRFAGAPPDEPLTPPSPGGRGRGTMEPPPAGFATGVWMSLPPEQIRRKLTPLLSPAEAGIATIDLRADAEKAAEGSSDLGELMLMLGFVLVLAALALAGTVMALNVRARAGELRLFDAIGAPLIARRVFLLECSALAFIGALMGVPLGIGFAALSLAMLGRFMPAQASLGAVAVRPSQVEILFGFAASALAGLAAGAVAVRMATGRPRRATRKRPGRPRPWGGLAMVVARSVWANPGRFAGQTLVSFGASFVLAAVAANIRPSALSEQGFSLIAETSIPVNVDFGSPTGRDRLRFDPANETVYQGMRVLAMRQSPGDDASCLNPAKPAQPRVAGVPGGPSARGPRAGQAPALLPNDVLDKLTDETPAPAVGDAESVEWVLGSGEGKTLQTPGGPVRFVALTRGTALAGHILVSEKAFRRMFPAVAGPTLFLIQTSKPSEVAKALRGDLADAGIDVRLASEEVAALHGVQNAYLSIFLCLGLVGVLLGTIGAALLALRSAAERRGEFALMLAIGLTRPQVGLLLCSESVLAVLMGVILGTAAAQFAFPAGGLVWVALGAALTVAVTVLACTVVAAAFLRSSLLEALRSE